MDHPRSYAPAQTLTELFPSLQLKELGSEQEMLAFYAPELNLVRGEDKVKRFAKGLERAYGQAFYKLFVFGHLGCGKSTELKRLADAVASRYRPIFFSAYKQLDPAGAEALDVLLLMLVELTEAVARHGMPAPSDDVVKRIWNWFGDQTSTVTTQMATEALAGAGLGLEATTWWGKLFGLNAQIKGELKASSLRERSVTEKQMRRLGELIDAFNSLLSGCNKALREKERREWLFIGDDFEKVADHRMLEEIFVRYGNVFVKIDAHMIFTIPVDLAYSQGQLPFEKVCIPDAPVYDAFHEPHTAGRAALERVLDRRASPALFEPGQKERIIVASGGYLRTLFSLVTEAATDAELAETPSPVIRSTDVTRSIGKHRREMLLRLGEDPYTAEPASYSDKIKRLRAIYNRDPDAQAPDPILYQLLRARAVQDFSGDGRFGVAPLVVDILKDHGLPRDAKGVTI